MKTLPTGSVNQHDTAYKGKQKSQVVVHKKHWLSRDLVLPVHTTTSIERNTYLRNTKDGGDAIHRKYNITDFHCE